MLVNFGKSYSYTVFTNTVLSEKVKELYSLMEQADLYPNPIRRLTL